MHPKTENLLVVVVAVLFISCAGSTAVAGDSQIDAESEGSQRSEQSESPPQADNADSPDVNTENGEADNGATDVAPLEVEVTEIESSGADIEVGRMENLVAQVDLLSCYQQARPGMSPDEGEAAVRIVFTDFSSSDRPMEISDVGVEDSEFDDDNGLHDCLETRLEDASSAPLSLPDEVPLLEATVTFAFGFEY